MTDYDMFVHNMWVENCNERDSYGEPRLDKEQYLLENREYLLDKEHYLRSLFERSEVVIDETPLSIFTVL